MVPALPGQVAAPLERYRGTHTVVADRDATRQQVIYSHRIRKVEQGVISFSEEGGWISSGNRGWGDAGWDDSPVRGWDSEFLSGRAAAPEVFYVSNQTVALRRAAHDVAIGRPGRCASACRSCVLQRPGCRTGS